VEKKGQIRIKNQSKSRFIKALKKMVNGKVEGPDQIQVEV